MNALLTHLAIIMGFCMAMLTGYGIASAFINALYFLWPAPVVFLMKISVNLLSTFLIAPGIYLQLLKHFQIWPMEQSSPLTFKPWLWFTDLALALRSFDWEILKAVGQLAINWLQPKIKQILEPNNYDPNSELRWWYLLREKCKSTIRTVNQEVAAPVLVREGICLFIHEKHYCLLFNQQLKALSEQQKQACLNREKIQYALTPFMFNLATSQKGFFESIGVTIQNEWQQTLQAPAEVMQAKR